jgi:hypothetical protein
MSTALERLRSAMKPGGAALKEDLALLLEVADRAFPMSDFDPPLADALKALTQESPQP